MQWVPIIAQKRLHLLTSLLQKIDYDSTSSHTMNFTVQVRDPDPAHTDIAEVSIVIFDVNDNPPVFVNPHQVINITENKAQPNLIRFLAKDIDSGLNGEFQ